MQIPSQMIFDEENNNSKRQRKTWLDTNTRTNTYFEFAVALDLSIETD